jgi:hypothetical protein
LRLSQDVSRLFGTPADDGDPGTLFGDYHLSSASPAIDVGSSAVFTPPALDALLAVDIDDQTRPTFGTTGTVEDIGADEYVPGAGLLNVCAANIDLDYDVDGSDLVNATVPAAAIAAEFGRTDCLR